MDISPRALTSSILTRWSGRRKKSKKFLTQPAYLLIQKLRARPACISIFQLAAKYAYDQSQMLAKIMVTLVQKEEWERLAVHFLSLDG